MRLARARKKRAVGWVPVLLCMAVIFILSSQPYYKQNLRPAIQATVPLGWITKVATPISFHYGGHEVSIQHRGEAAFVEFFIRKAAHFTEYALFGFFVFKAAQSLFNKRTRLWYLATMVLLFVALYAASDEWHQRFVPDRTPSAEDVVLDTCGAAAGIFLAYYLGKGRKKHKF